MLLNVLKANLHSSIVCWKRRNTNLADRKNVNLLYEIESLKIFEIFQRISINFIVFVKETLNLAPAEFPSAAARECATQKSDIDPRP